MITPNFPLLGLPSAILVRWEVDSLMWIMGLVWS